MPASLALKPIAVEPAYDWRVDLSAHVFAGVHTRAEAMVAAASLLCVGGCNYEHLGRGPDRFDELGFVRACVQAALDVFRTHRQRASLADLAGYRPAPETWRHPDQLNALFREWGLELVTDLPMECMSKAQPGDVIAYTGKNAWCAVMLKRAEEPKGKDWRHVVAGVFAPNPPRAVTHPGLMCTPAFLWRLPEGYQ
ncbi:MAG TPA: hypothetical protein VEA79_14170 [Phenylobacterium sp.]|nr:hypothetical protein [Phenylobacterium sp.]